MISRCRWCGKKGELDHSERCNSCEEHRKKSLYLGVDLHIHNPTVWGTHWPRKKNRFFR